MKIIVFGYKGMLGNYIYTYFKSKGFDVRGLSRDMVDITNFTDRQLKGMLYHKLDARKGDVIVNCIGTVKPQVDKLGTTVAIDINARFPHYLSELCEEEEYKLIHITTDCVFSGNGGQYNEKSLHDALDVYGKTKSLGEPLNCTVIRTSIIGEEVGQSRSLLEWVKSMRNKAANGYTNHKWNGVTCLQLAKVIEDIVTNNKYWQGIARHIFSPEVVTKHELVQMISDVYNLNINVVPIEAPTKCDRSLTTIFTDTSFNIPPLKQQIEEQFNFFNIKTQ